jgi:hypothetical protein
MIYKDRMNADTFIKFMKRLIKDAETSNKIFQTFQDYICCMISYLIAGLIKGQCDLEQFNMTFNSKSWLLPSIAVCNNCAKLCKKIRFLFYVKTDVYECTANSKGKV